MYFLEAAPSTAQGASFQGEAQKRKVRKTSQSPCCCISSQNHDCYSSSSLYHPFQLPLTLSQHLCFLDGLPGGLTKICIPEGSVPLLPFSGWACCTHILTVKMVQVPRGVPVSHLGAKPTTPHPHCMAATQVGSAQKKQVKPRRLILNHFLSPPSDNQPINLISFPLVRLGLFYVYMCIKVYVFTYICVTIYISVYRKI